MLAFGAEAQIPGVQGLGSCGLSGLEVGVLTHCV